MSSNLKMFAAAATCAGAASLSSAQPSINWFTVDSGGGALAGGAFTLGGTIGQPDAFGTLSGGAFTVIGGFWTVQTRPPCAADFNLDGSVDFFDYLDFVDAFSSANPSADFNGDSVIDFFDYLDFVDSFSIGC